MRAMKHLADDAAKNPAMQRCIQYFFLYEIYLKSIFFMSKNRQMSCEIHTISCLFFLNFVQENVREKMPGPYFGHPAQTSSFTKYKFLLVKKSYATISNRLSVLKWFQLFNGDLLFS